MKTEGYSSKSLNCVERNELVKQVNALKNEKEESLNKLEQIKKTIYTDDGF